MHEPSSVVPNAHNIADTPPCWGDCFRAPSDVGSSEYRALVALLLDINDIPNECGDFDPTTALTPEARNLSLAALDELIACAKQARQRLEGAQLPCVLETPAQDPAGTLPDLGDGPTSEYIFDLGNSSTGPCGLIAYVHATSKDAAIRSFGEWVREDGYKVYRDDEFELILYVNADRVTRSDVELSEGLEE